MTTPSTALLCYPKGLRVLGIDIDPLDLKAPIHVLIASTSRRTRCPRCGRYANRVHSRYHRTLHDLPCTGRAIVAHLQVRRFRCMSPRCTTKLFCERLGELADPYAHRTKRTNASLACIGMTDGGRAGSRLAARLGLPASRMTLLRLVRAIPCPTAPTPTALGVDDFALRRGHNYGTILYDLERHVVIDLLPDRSAQSLTAWLKAHPGVEMISRDRAEAYAQGARDGAPDAQQVADRWHVLTNLGDALEHFFNQHQATLREAAREEDTSSGPPQADPPEPGPPARLNPNQEQIQQHRAARLARYDAIHRLHEEGYTKKAIAAHFRMGQSTVRKFLRTQAFPERAQRAAVPGKLGPFHALIRERWEAGNRDLKLLLGELKSLGYTGSLTRLYDYVQILRQQGKPHHGLKAGAGKFSVRQVVSMLLTPERTPEQQMFLDRLTTNSVIFATARGLAERFTTLIRKRPREDAHVPLGLWVAEAVSSSIAPLASFARGLRDDWEAVVAGLSLKWSQGPVEGAVNRLKMIKRQMFGRANFDLLRRRVLPAT
jgi:transposase